MNLTPAKVEEIVGAPFETTANECHVVSLKIVKSGVLGPSRVARGFCRGIPRQHSWIVLGRDCYRVGARIVDPTLWCYDDSVTGVWTGVIQNGGRHVPHGSGSIWDYGKPVHRGGTTIELNLTKPLSRTARSFLNIVGPLDRDGWAVLAHAPVLGWPAGEIFAAMCDTPDLRVMVPIDVIGMITDRNPGGLYW